MLAAITLIMYFLSMFLLTMAGLLLVYIIVTTFLVPAKNKDQCQKTIMMHQLFWLALLGCLLVGYGFRSAALQCFDELETNRIVETRP